MKIRDKLFLGFGFYIMFAVVCGFVAYKDLSRITTRLNLVEVADDITNTILEVRRYEKNYLLFRDEESLREFKKYLGYLKRYTDNIKSEIVLEIGEDSYGKMKGVISDYERLFDSIEKNFRSQNELVEMTRNIGRNIENSLSGQDLRTFLVLRRHEKNLMLYKDAASRNTFLDIFRSIGRRNELDGYGSLIDRLYTLYTDEKKTIEDMRKTAREIQSFTENISKREREEISRILRSSMTLVVMSLAFILILGTLINIKLATSIATPIGRLERITKKVSQGDFSEAIEVEGEDEIASLQLSFNQMKEKLKDAMSSLELTIERLKEQQDRLVEAEKLASIGKLAAGIAHEINNPLTSVLTFSSLMLEQTPEDDPKRQRLRMIVQETTRARNIVRHVLNFAKEAPMKMEKINVNRPVSEIIDSLSEQGAFGAAELSVDLADGLPDVRIDAGQIGQVVMNMLLNAVHAVGPQGKILVGTKLSGDFVEISFKDDGCGIPEENLKKIFDPFFTTKDKSKGTGLGLAVSYGIIKTHGGEILVQSEPGKGTEFKIRLPLYG